MGSAQAFRGDREQLFSLAYRGCNGTRRLLKEDIILLTLEQHRHQSANHL